MTFQEESYDEIYNDLQPLIKHQKGETGMFDDIKLDPNWIMFKKLYEVGFLSILTIRKDKQLLGYYISFISRHPHYDMLVSENTLLYIVPKYRGVALKFFRFVQKHLKDKGVALMVYSIKEAKDFTPLAKRLGHELLEYKYFMRLDKWEKQ